MKPLLLPVASLLLLSSCVSTRKYEAALAREQDLLGRTAQLNTRVDELSGQITELQTENARLLSNLDAAMGRASQAAGQVTQTQAQLEAEQRRLRELRDLLDQQRQAAESLRQKMAAALTNFNSNELTVSVRNGRVYVSLQENLLFPSGSAVVNPKGVEALGSLAGVLNANTDIRVMIEGHTDSIPIRGRYEDNWALSTARAASIVRILTGTYAVDPVRVTASGRSYFDPVDTNSTPEGRARNRRTEIILSPRLDELMQLLESPRPAVDSPQ